jgi:hypothetical protein
MCIYNLKACHLVCLNFCSTTCPQVKFRKKINIVIFSVLCNSIWLNITHFFLKMLKFGPFQDFFSNGGHIGLKVSICWWQKSDIWSQVSYRYPISWEAVLDPSDSYFLFADFVDFYTHWTYMLIWEQGYNKIRLEMTSGEFFENTV